MAGKPAVYHLAKDELYELDSDSFRFMRASMGDEGCDAKGGPFIDYCMDEGSLRRTEPASSGRCFDSPLSFPPLPGTPDHRCLQSHLQTLLYRQTRAGKELSAEQVRAILSEFEKMQGLRVLISGGEPLIHSRLGQDQRDAARFLSAHRPVHERLLLTKGKAESLNVDEIQVSIDGLEAAHDVVGARARSDRSMEAVHHALDAGFDVSISTMVHRAILTRFRALSRCSGTWA